MRQPIILCSPLLATLAFASFADAATTLYASPTGTETAGCTRAAPCDLTSAVGLVAAGDTVVLMDGVYKTALDVKTSGTASAWITFQADDCATPIFEGPGDDVQTTGVGSAGTTKGSYLRFIGLVARGWNTGFGNHWVKTDATPPETPPSNGNIEYRYCIGEGNGRTGFTHYSASGIRIQNCISAHNGSSLLHSWSSGITLYATSESSGEALVEGCLSFENMDAQQHTDGSGFIVDERSNNATFRNNIAFRNGGGCFRLTKSSGTKFINNTCYHDAQDSQDQGPSNPGEVYFTQEASNSTTTGVTFLNNVFVATGTGPGAAAIYNQPTSGWTSNTVTTGSVSYFTDPDGTNPDFTLKSGSTLIGKGSSGAPTNDAGFDPKCITKKAPTMVGSIAKGSWWQYSVDLDYIKNLGGVAKCFHPKTRSGTPDIGAYANGTVTVASPPCTMPPQGGATSTGGATSAGGAPSAGGTSNAGGTTNVGGTTSKGGTTSNAGGASSKGGTSAGGSTSTVTTNAGGNTSTSSGGSTSGGSGGTATANAGGNTSSSNGGSATSNPNAGGNASSSGGTGQTSSGGGTSVAAGGSASNIGGNATTGSVSKGGGNASGGNASTGTATPGSGDNAEAPASGCGCRIADQSSSSTSLAGLGLLALLALRVKRRRESGR